MDDPFYRLKVMWFPIKFILSLFGILAIIIIVINLLDPSSCPTQSQRDYIYNLNFKSKLIRKGSICEKNLLELTLEDKENNEEFKLILQKNWICLFNDIKKGDSLIKANQSMEFLIKRNGNLIFHKFECDPSCECFNIINYPSKK